MSDSESIWREYPLQAGVWQHWAVGELRQWCRCVNDELHLATQHGPDTRELVAGQNDEPPPTTQRERWTMGAPVDRLTLAPTMPDRPLVVRPSCPVHLPKGCGTVFFVSVPVWIAVSAGDLPVCEQPTRVLSNTWFGDPTSGELSYSLKTTAQRDLQVLERRVHCAVSPVRISNESNEELELERICLRTSHLQIYQSSSRLWTTPVHIALRSEDKTDVHYHKDPPEFESVTLLAPAREAPSEGFLKGFQYLKSIVCRGAGR